MSDRKFLVTGATSKLGRQVVSFLLNDFKLPAKQIIATSRNVEKLADLKGIGVDVRQADFARPASLVTAFEGADSLLLISMDAVGERDVLHTNAVKAAENAGVSFITYTSMPAANESPLVFAFEHKATEQAIADSAINNWMILRNNWYFENLTEFFASTLQTSTWLTAAAQGKTAQISRTDLAFGAAAALFKSQNGKTTLTLNGSKSLTVDEMAAAINDVIATQINVVHVSDEDFRNQLTSFQLPEGIVQLSSTMDIHNRDNLSDGTSDEFELLTGRKPQTFNAWLTINKEQLLAIANSAS